jgi:APA family basic amino acid/polyamine antiporter
MPGNSAMIGLFISGLWLLYFYGGPLCGWFGPIAFDSSELPIVTLYGCYIPVFFLMMLKEKDLSPVKRFVFPGLSILCCIFMVVAAFIGHGANNVFWYLVVFSVFMLVGVLVRGKNRAA